MRERINQAARGAFEYNQSVMTVSVEEVVMDINAGESKAGSFIVSNESGRVMRGTAASDHHFLEITQEVFEGAENEISFVFHAETLLPGNSQKGMISLVTDCGIRTVPFTVSVGVPFCEVSSGKIRDLFHFTNLARENEEEAAALFRTPHFVEVFLQQDNIHIELYQGLSRGASRGMAMEEFLIAIHKKLPVQLSVNKNHFQYEGCEKSFTDRFVITKNNWGYGEYHITSDSAFVVPERRIIWSSDFVGNTYSMPFLVDVDKMQAGRNYARLTVSSVRQTMEITIVAAKAGKRHEATQERLAAQRNLYQLMQLHLEFCMDRMDRDDYLQAVGNIVYTMEKDGKSILTQLFKLHLGIMEHREQAVKNGLAFLHTQKEKLKEQDYVMYCACLYLQGLWADDDEEIEECVEEIRECYKRDGDNWKLLWFLLYLAPEYAQSDSRKYESIIAQLKRECHSPMIFLELCSLLNEHEDYLTELTKGVCEAIHWGCKRQFVTKEVALRYCYLAGKLKEYSKSVKEDLCLFYTQFKEEEILASICKMLMKGQVTDKDAFQWYSLGVEHNLRLTDLYEYYMYSIDEEQEIHLSNNTLLYFLYDNHLTMNKKAMLYAYVVQNRDELGDTYGQYRPVIEEFAMRQLASGKISNNLAVLYEEFVSEDTITAEVAKQLPEVMFCHEILCGNPRIVGVYVMHRELAGEVFVPLKRGRAVVNIYTENYQVLLADKLDNRYALSIDYTVNKMVHLNHLAQKCLAGNPEDFRLLLYLQDQAERMNRAGKESTDIRRKILEVPYLSNYQYRKGFASLVRYYYDNFEGEALDATLEKLDWSVINPSQRREFVEYCCVRRFFDKAMEGIRLYGYEGMEAKRLLKISSDTYGRSLDEEDTQLVKLAWYIFQNGQFDENMIRYLCRYYLGGLNDMVQIWRYANGFAIDMGDFSERILGMVVFTGMMSPDAYEVFYDYYEAGKDKRLILAFMKFIAYKHLVHGWLIPDQMFHCFYREVQVQDNLFCLVASLKYLSQKRELSIEEARFADYNINKLYDRRIVFPFYRDFYGKFALPIHILDECYVEYITNPEYEVKIHYLISSGYEEGEFITETMRDIFCGIRVKEFVLFQDEMLQYYITEVRPEGEVLTKSVSLSFDETMDNERTSSRYHMLNLMMIAQEMKEEGTLVDMMKEYVQIKECTNILFNTLE